MMQRFEEQPRDLYTIPISSSWFNWDAIHETERISLPEFFNHSSYSRNPRVYKEYRDFIINKFREDPSRRLTFTEVRKSLIGDVGSLEKVFRFLDRWGLINFGIGKEEERSSAEVVMEEGVPAGVKVVSAITTVAGSGGAGGGGGGREGSGFRLLELSSYSDVFRDSMVCGVCGHRCVSERMESTKEGSYAMCSKCSESRKNKEEKSVDDSKPNNHIDVGDNHVNNAWTDAETLLLLEAVVKHGDDWDLIAQHVRTKSKLDCIAWLIHLPFGDHMLGPIRNKLDGSRSSVSEITKEAQNAPKEKSEEPIKADCEQHPDADEKTKGTDTDEIKNVAEEFYPSPPRNKRCLPSLTDVTNSLTEQVAPLSTVAGQHVAAAAAESAVAALCHENPCAQKAFEIYEGVGLSSKDEMEMSMSEDEDMKGHKKTEPSLEKSFGTTTFRIRAAIATALGAAAAHAKLLADQEEREMELLIASLVETQVKKIKSKMKHFEELEVIMEKEYPQIQQLKESVLEDWVSLLRQTTNFCSTRTCN